MRVLMLTALILLCCLGQVSGGDKQSAAFDILDADRDGKISSTEFAAHFAGSNAEEAIAFVRTDDVDNDGVIALEEFGKKWKNSGAAAVSFHWDDIDINNDGVVTWKELQVRYPTAGKAAFRAADGNKDGFIDKKESLVLLRF